VNPFRLESAVHFALFLQILDPAHELRKSRFLYVGNFSTMGPFLAIKNTQFNLTSDITKVSL